MSRNLARRGASVLVASALLGGGLALGGGTASAEEAPGGVNDLVNGSVDFGNAFVNIPFGLFNEGMKLAIGSSDSDSVGWYGCTTDQDPVCGPIPN
ncbi:hypothetical protein [Rhodococcus sp. UNC363MFTsu5.1]|uniref:hypothetical protein n=1 Tax=Rhodococcus sp. UNC363MFTsu5.1 TaxID=1449069 RepID=UPI0004879622|nr:hypothetical protein [Rhodococcus sp. UNC363MFTsu5.1]